MAGWKPFRFPPSHPLLYTGATMVISYNGGQSFKVSFGDTTLAFNPASKTSKLSDPVKYGADAAFVSFWHKDFNGTDQVAHGTKQPFVVDTPGEFEIGSVVARGFGVKTTYDKIEGYNTIFQVRLEDMNMVFLGALNDPEIDPKILSSLETSIFYSSQSVVVMCLRCRKPLNWELSLKLSWLSQCTTRKLRSIHSSKKRVKRDSSQSISSPSSDRESLLWRVRWSYLVRNT